LNYVTGQKNHSKTTEIAISINFMEFQLIDVWSFLQQVCFVKTGAFTVGVLWNSIAL